MYVAVKFSAIVVGDSEVEVVNGSYYSILCRANVQASSFMWTFNGTPIQVIIIRSNFIVNNCR